MKNCTLIIAFIFSSACHLFASQPGSYFQNTSSLEIKSTGAAFITVSIDGNYFQEPVKHFSIANVLPGNHHIEIFTERISHSGYYSNTQVIKMFSGNILVKPATVIKAVIDNTGNFYIRNVEQVVSYLEYYDPYVQPYYTPGEQTVCEQHSYGSQMAMHEHAFTILLNTVNDQWFDDTRLTVAQQAIQTNWLSTSQVARLMHEMSFEESKLELAKSAYKKVTDRENYFMVNKEFWFSSSVDDLSEFIINYR